MRKQTRTLEEILVSSKYEIAKKRADEIDAEIIETLKTGKNFRVEAGAGSGKTYSLNKVIEWVEDNYWENLKMKKQSVACITYTNAGVNVIASRLRTDNFIKPMTIHSFAWELIGQFAQDLKQLVIELGLVPEGVTEKDFDKIQYTVGARYVENKILYLFHNDVIVLFGQLLEKEKFRKLLTLQYPIIFIDEYQDSLKVILNQFVKWFIDKKTGPQFGFFGDAWQTIYDKSSCGEIDSSELKTIRKESNFRSQQVIVEILNRIRPQLPQIPATDKSDGFIQIITCNDFRGKRQNGYYKGELPNEVLMERIDKVQEILEHRHGWKDNNSYITLMITHKMLAKQQSYVNLLELLDDRFKDGEDPYLKFFFYTIEPLYSALESKRLTSLYDALGSRNYPIVCKKQKRVWIDFWKELQKARGKTVGEVMDVIYSQPGINIPIPPKIQESHQKFLENPGNKYEQGTIGQYYGIPYSEVLSALEFLKPEAKYSTDHGVKGEEYENVLFIIGRGWNNYQFDKYMGCDPDALSSKEFEAFVRNRNLFYVCCSRPKSRLVLLITVKVEGLFLEYLQNIFGADNICTYNEFIDDEMYCNK